MNAYGLLGETLGHSFSPQIHALLADYEYGLYPTPREELEAFLNTTALSGMNVTIPYKKDVLSCCAWQSEAVQRIGSANTLVKEADGWHAYNTDYMGFRYLLESCGCSPKGKKVVVLGSGGASLAVRVALEDMEAGQIVIVSRSGEDNYGNLHRHADAAILVNTTPVGMYPQVGEAPVNLEAFPACEAVFDIVYNPSRTALLLQAEEKGLLHRGGLAMLVAQAHRAAELFTGREIPKAKIEEILHVLEKQTQNLILIGMPGCGKSSVGRALAGLTGRKFMDSDVTLQEMTGMFPADIIREQGEAAFRGQETEALRQLGKESGLVIATGGGCVTRPENYPLLHQNGKIIWLQRDLELLPTDGRPLSQQGSLEKLYEMRKALYERFADYVVNNDAGSPAETARKILEALS